MRDVQRNTFVALIALLLTFLFAVVRDVQRNGSVLLPGLPLDSFYSLSCETYSGTRPGGGRCRRSTFLFAVVRDVQRNLMSPESYSDRCMFPFAVVRDVQRNYRKMTIPAIFGLFLFAVVRDVQRNVRHMDGHRRGRGFYSLSCETYSGTLRWLLLLTVRVFLFAVVRDVQRNSTAM